MTNMIIIKYVLVNVILSSFMAMLIARIPSTIGHYNSIETIKTLSHRSSCNHCKHLLCAADLIPIISFIFLQSRCRYCKSKIDGINFYTEVIFVPIAIFCSYYWHTPNQILLHMLFIDMLWVIACIDHQHLIIPDCINYILLWAGLLIQTTERPSAAAIIILGVILSYLFLKSTDVIYTLIRNHSGIGGGDIKMFAMLSVWVGATALPLLLLIACSLAIINSLFKLPKPWSKSLTIPFGPCLALSALIIIILSKQSILPVNDYMLKLSL